MIRVPVKPGSLIQDRFRIERVVARGGMGTVYRALDEARGEPVAVKVLERAFDLGDERFKREAAVLSSLRHPAIVGYVSHGTAPEGPYIAMEWLDGEALSERLRAGLLPPAEAVALTRRVADALALAHGQGIVHRDVKPSNLFLVDGEPRRVVVLDFGIARRLIREDDVTEPGSIVGTWSYIAPEQALARAGVDARADVFSLGCVLYECLTGARAFAAGERTAVLAKLLLEEPPRVTTLRSDVPLALDRLVARMMSKEPDARPRDGAAVARDLVDLGDVELLPRRVPSTLPPGLTDREQRVLSIVLARGFRDPDATVDDSGVASTVDPLLETVSTLASEVHVLANGSLLAVISARGNPRDGAVKAARCALAIKSERPSAEVALATGFGVVSAQTPVGVVIDRGVEALRRASPGAIRLDDTTASLVAEHFRLRRDADGASLGEERNELDVSRKLLGRESPFVGRSAELSTLLAAAEACAEDARAKAALVVGDAGSGKSRLALELCARLSPSWEVCFARADSVSAGSPYQLLSRLVRQSAGIGERDVSALQRQKIQERLAPWLADPRERDRAVAFVCEVLRAPLEDADRPWLAAARADARLMNDAIKRAFADWFAAETRARPLLLVFDDLSWGDVPSIDVVDALLARLADAPLLVLGLSRPHPTEPWAARSPIRIPLAPLANRAAQRLVRTALGDEVDAHVVAALVARSEGNAFALEELIRAAAQGHEQIPESVLGMVQARLDDLDATERRVLRAASVFGERFTASGVEALLDPDVRTASVLHSLVERELLEGTDELVFRHALVRQAAYALLTDADRKLGHRLAALHLAADAGADEWTVAFHFREAGEGERAAGYYLQGAERALAGNDYAGVLRAVETAMACSPEPALAGALRWVEAQALRWLSRSEEASLRAREARDLLPVGSRVWFEAVRETALAAATLARFDDCLEMIELAIATPPAPDAELTKAITILHACGSALEGVPHGRVRDVLLRAGEPPAMADPRVGAWWHGTQALLAHCAGDPVRYVQETEQALAAHERRQDARMTCLMGMNLGYGLTELGDFARAEELLRAAASTAAGLGIVRTVAYAEHNLGYTLACAGRLEEARRVEQRAAEAAEALEAPTLASACHTYLAGICVELGDLDAAVAHGQSAIEAAGERSVLPMAQAALARAHAARGELDEALDLAQAAVAAFDADRALGEDETAARLVLVEILQRRGDTARASVAIAEAHERLLARAARISDATLRAAFLERIPHNARTLELYRR